MDACFPKIPREGREAWGNAIVISRDAWREGARQPAARQSVETACLAASRALADNPVSK
jgi:hypothetical protein